MTSAEGEQAINSQAKGPDSDETPESRFGGAEEAISLMRHFKFSCLLIAH